MDFLKIFIFTLIALDSVLCGLHLKHNDAIKVRRKSDMNEYKRKRSTYGKEIQKRQAEGREEESVATGECHVEF